jgi:hypothetical protein
MDGDRFDDLSRTLAAGISRRKVLAGVAAGLLGTLGIRGSAGAGVSQIYCGNVACASSPGRCKPGCVCCVYTNPITGRVMNSRCRPPGTCNPGDVVCPAGKVADPVRGCIDPCSGPGGCPQPPAGSCRVATCATSGLCGTATAPDDTVCGTGRACCDGGCTTLGTTSNCSACGDACTANQACTAGACTCLYESCNGACCASGQVCIGGVCTARAGEGQSCDSSGENDCQTGLTCCSGTCRDLESNPDFCGSCTRVCATPTAGTCQGARICVAGECGFSPAPATAECRPSSGLCDPAEVCNGTDLTCPTDDKTPSGQPGSCAPGQVCCNGGCTALGTVTNCASCGNACTIKQDCRDGACICPNEICDGACCASGEVCIDGACGARAGDGQPCDTTGANDCQNGLTCCGGTCRDLQTNPDFCGDCDTVCAAVTANTCQEARICSTGSCGFRPKAANTVCRTSTGPCDPAEVCNGSDLTCPTDLKTGNGQPGTCGGGQVCCGGASCTTLGTTTNCAFCGNACSNNQVCNSGVCTCPNATCGSVCCAAGQACIGGVCRARSGEGGTCDTSENGDCADGLVCCGTTCRRLGTNANCASCGNACPADHACVGGTCKLECTSDNCGKVAGCGTGASCRTPEGSRPTGTCQADGQCCLASGASTGGVPGEWCSTVNCCASCNYSANICF